MHAKEVFDEWLSLVSAIPGCIFVANGCHSACQPSQFYAMNSNCMLSYVKSNKFIYPALSSI